MNYKNKKWKGRRPSQERITFQKVGDRTMPTEPPIRRLKYSSPSYNVSLTLDDGTVTVSGKAKGAYTPSITGRMPKGGKLELAYTFLPLAGEEDLDEITAADLGAMLEAGLNGLCGIVDAKVGDKTLVDTLAPSVDVMKAAGAEGKDFKEALAEMKAAAEAGRDSTKDMVAKFGRSSRLGERSRGVLDAGATSCCIILSAMADGISELL